MADIDILVDSTQVKTAKQELAELGNSFNSAAKSASIFMQAFQKAAAQSARDTQYIREASRAYQELINTNLKITNSYSSAEASAKAMVEGLRQQEAQALKTARANQELINTQLGVGGPSATAGGASFSAMEAEINSLATRYNSVYAASQLYEKELQNLNRANQLGVISTKQYEAELERLNAEYQQYANSTEGAALAGNRFANHVNATRSGLNSFGVVAQQVGYQVGDFFVQIQSGTSAFVAFGQQATQLAGLIPGIGGAIAGIGISVVTAFLSFREKALEAAEGTKELDNAVKSLDESLKSYLKTQEASNLGITPDQLTAAEALKKAEEDLAKAQEDRAKIVAAQGAAGYTTLVSQNEQLALIKNAEAEIEKAQERILQIRKRSNDLLTAETKDLTFAHQLEMARLEFGEDSLVYKNLAAQADRRAFVERVRALDIEESMQNALIRNYDQFKAQEKALKDSKDQAQALRDLMDAWDGKEFQATLSIKMPEMSTGNLDWAQNQLGFILPGSELLPPQPEVSSGGTSGVGASAVDSQLQSLVESLQYQREALTEWYDESKTLLQSASDQELEVLGGKYEAMARLDAQYRQKVFEAQQAQSQMSFQAYAGMFSALGELLSVFAGKSKGAAVAALAIQKGLAIAQIITSTAAAQMRAYAELGPIAGAAMAAKIGLLGKMQMALVAATGIAQAGQIMSGGDAGSTGGGGSGGGGPKGSASVSTTTTTSAAQTVYISGLDPNALFTGEQLANLFDSFYKENDNRGKVFVVAR